MHAEIIEPIQSRCAILRFTKLSDAEILERLQDICEKEKVEFELPGLEVRARSLRVVTFGAVDCRQCTRARCAH